MLDIIKNKTSLQDELSSLRKAILDSKVYNPKKAREFVFLCGANASNQNISARRKALMKFAETHLSDVLFFIAEDVFFTLEQEAHKGNLLDIEDNIAEFADKIIIVLESESAFTELGFFSHTKLRNKLIVINNSKFIESKSFINMGPIKAIEETPGKERIIYYKMREDGVHKVDSIGDVYAPLYEILSRQHQKRSSPISPINLDDCNPGIHFNKKSAMMVHDLIYFSGPILHAELVEVLKIIFGSQSFNKVKEHEALLVAINSLERSKKKHWYKSKLRKPYYHYKFDTNSLISVYRNYMLKFYPERFNEH